MKTLRIIFCGLCFCFTTYMFAQSNEYLNAYVINLEGDTLRGYIKDEARKDMAEQFNFKENLDGAIETFSPTSALGFFMKPSFYFESVEVKKEGLLNGDRNRMGQLQISTIDSILNRQYFKYHKYIEAFKNFLRAC